MFVFGTLLLNNRYKCTASTRTITRTCTIASIFRTKMRVQVQLHMYTHVSFGARPASADALAPCHHGYLEAVL